MNCVGAMIQLRLRDRHDGFYLNSPFFSIREICSLMAIQWCFILNYPCRSFHMSLLDNAGVHFPRAHHGRVADLLEHTIFEYL